MTWLRNALAGLALALLTLAPAFGQPVQWSYNFVNGVATATYPGNVVMQGTCTGCFTGPQLNLPQTWTATQTFQGNGATLGLVTPNIGEPATIVAGAPAATQNYDILAQSVLVYTSNAANNWTLNLRGNGSTSLNSLMSIGQAVTCVLLAAQGATPFYNNAVTIDGVSVTPLWQGGSPIAGNASGTDVYSYTIIKTGSAAYTVLASQIQFK